MNFFLPILIVSIFGHNNCFSLSKRQVSNLCSNSPCLNGGKCVQVSINLAYCACINGYTGTTCNIGPAIVSTNAPPVTTTTTAVSVCLPGICKNDGVCQVLSGNLAYCQCKNGFTGTFCEIPPTVQTTNLPPATTTTLSQLCSANPCKNGGTCMDLSNNLAYCKCPQEYGGSFCETLIGSTTLTSTSSTTSTESTSTSSTTSTTSTSTSSTTSTTSTSTSSTTSTESTSTSSTTSTTSTSTSSTTSTTSTSTSSTTSTTSTSTTSSTTTSIVSDSTTTTSESTTTTPLPKPCPSQFKICQNNGTCLVTEAGSISCNCPLPYTGAFCEEENQFCDLNPCKNGATCSPTEGIDGECQCPTGYSGRTCNIRQCEASNPCQNSLACLEIDGQFECLCKTGFTGEFCETKL